MTPEQQRALALARARIKLKSSKEEPEQPKEVSPAGPTDFSFQEMVSNIPESAGKFASDITYPIKHPVKTAQSLSGLALGSLDKVANALKARLPESVVSTVDKADEWLEGAGIRSPEKAQENQALAGQVGQFYKDRYGSVDKAKQTFMTDPVGGLADTAGVLGGVGIAAKAALPAKLGRVGRGIKNVAAAMEPTNIVANAVKIPLKAIPKATRGHVVDAVANLLPRHRKRAGHALNEISGTDAPDIIKSLDNPVEIVPGSLPTAGQAAAPVGNRKFAAIDSLMEGRQPTAHGRLMDSQRIARVQSIERGIAKTPDEYKAAVKLRKEVTDPLYKASRESIDAVDVKPVIARIDKLVAENPGNRPLLKEMKALKEGLVQAVSRDTPLASIPLI